MQNVNEVSGVPKLPAFNKTIEISIEVDSVYKKLLDTFPADYKHKEILSHAIIGSAVNNGGLDYVYNALNGYTNNVDFEVGDKVVCSLKERIERYDSNLEDEEGNKKEVFDNEIKPVWKTRLVPIGECEVIKIDMYSRDKLTVKFWGLNRYDTNGKESWREETVNHRKCTKVVLTTERDVYKSMAEAVEAVHKSK